MTITFAWEKVRKICSPPPSPLKKLELVHSFTIFVLGDVIVFIIKLHYSSAIAVCACFIVHTFFHFDGRELRLCLLRQYFRAGVALDEKGVLARCILKPSRREDT